MKLQLLGPETLYQGSASDPIGGFRPPDTFYVLPTMKADQRLCILREKGKCNLGRQRIYAISSVELYL